jgi:hypothetical protein
LRAHAKASLRIKEQAGNNFPIRRCPDVLACNIRLSRVTAHGCAICGALSTDVVAPLG